MHWFDCFKCRLWKFDSWAEKMHDIAQLKSVRYWKKSTNMIWQSKMSWVALYNSKFGKTDCDVLANWWSYQLLLIWDSPLFNAHLRQATVDLRPATAILWSSLSCHHLYHCPWPSGFKTNMARIDLTDLFFLSKYSAINQTLNLVFAIVKIYFYNIAWTVWLTWYNNFERLGSSRPSAARP